MSNPLKVTRQVANDLRPPRSSAVIRAARVKTITLTYRPVKPGRYTSVFAALLLCFMTGASVWYASKTFALFVASKMMVVDVSIPLLPPRPVIIHAPAPKPIATAVAQPVPQAAPPAPEPVTVQPVPINETPSADITLPAEKSAPVEQAVMPPPPPPPTADRQMTVTTDEFNEEQMLDDARVLFENGDSKGALAAYNQCWRADKTNQSALAAKAYRPRARQAIRSVGRRKPPVAETVSKRRRRTT